MAGTSNKSLATFRKFIISTIAIFVSAVFLGYTFEKTKPVASRICAVQYPVGDESTATLYGSGPADVICILFYVAVALMLTSCIEDIIENWTLSQNEDFSQQMVQILFYISSYLFGLYVLLKGSYDWGTYLNGLPDHNVLFLMKVFYIYQFGFLIQCFPQAMLQGLSLSEALTSLVEAEVLLIFLVITYMANYTPMAVAVLMIHHATHLLFQLAVITSDSRSFKSLMKRVLFAAEHLLTLGAAICFCMYGDSREQPLRYLVLAFAIAWAFLSGQTMYKVASDGGRASSSAPLGLLPTSSATRKTSAKRRKGSRSRKGRGDRKSSRGRGRK